MGAGIDLGFVHGIGGSTTELDAVQAYLPRGWLAAAVDLPGHGHGGDLNGAVDVPALADEVARTLPPPTATTVLIGHSTGGVLLLDAVSRGVATPAALVLIDSNVPVGAARAAKRDKAAQATGAGWWEFFSASVADSIGTETDPATRAAIEHRVRRVARSTIRTIWRAVLTYDATEAWTACRCPVLYLRTTRALSAAELQTARAGRGTSVAPIEVVTLPAALGHYSHLTAPMLVMSSIERFVQRHVPPAGTAHDLTPQRATHVPRGV